VSGIGSDTAEAEDRRDDGDDKEDNCPLQHKIPFQGWISDEREVRSQTRRL
jgi:hypothetical protein